MDFEQAHALAQGRVWSGRQALENGLVDQVGGLGHAVAYAAQAAGLREWEIYEFPRPAEFADLLAEMVSPQQAPLVRDPMQNFLSDVRSDLRSFQLLNDPRGIYARMPFTMRIE